MKVWCASLLALVFVVGGIGFAGAQESPLIGKKAPDFTLERLSGKSASLSEVIKDKKAILFFFATWCPHCREQLKQISARKAEFGPGLQLFSLISVSPRTMLQNS